MVDAPRKSLRYDLGAAVLRYKGVYAARATEPQQLQRRPFASARPEEALMQTPAILSVLGEDRVGIVARVSAVLAESRANIEDIRQTIIGGIFSMTMLVTVDEDMTPFDEVQRRLAVVGEEIGLQITLQREDVFRYMHRV